MLKSCSERGGDGSYGTTVPWQEEIKKKIDALLIDLAHYPVNGILTWFTVAVYQCVCVSVKIFCRQSLLLACNGNL